MFDGAPVFDVHRLHNRGTGPQRIGPTGTSLFQHGAIGIQQRFELTGVVPSGHVDDSDLGAVIDHVLEGIGEIPLALVRRGGEHVTDALEQQLPVLDVVQTDVGALRDRILRLLDNPGHVTVLVGDDDAEALIVLDFLRPDDAVVVAVLDDAEVGIENRVHENDQHRLIHERLRQRHGAGRPVLYRLLDEHARDIVRRSRICLHLFLQVAGDVHHLLHVAEFEHIVHHVAHDRAAGDLQHRLRRHVRVRAETSAFAGEGDNDLHVELSPEWRGGSGAAADPPNMQNGAVLGEGRRRTKC